MSTTYVAAVKAISENPELLAKISKAGSQKERAEILSAAGVAVPTQADINAHIANMVDVSGFAAAATSIYVPAGAAAGMAVGAAAAGCAA